MARQSPFYGWHGVLASLTTDANPEAVALTLPRLPARHSQESHFRCPTGQWSTVSLPALGSTQDLTANPVLTGEPGWTLTPVTSST